MSDIGITIDLEQVDNAKLWNYIMQGWQGIIATVVSSMALMVSTKCFC